MPQELKKKMEKEGYHFVGKHSAIKTCEYTSKALRGETLCYKNTFYGIKSWQCMQSTTAIGCDLACRFCWRLIPEEEGFKWNELNAIDEWDDPNDIADGLIKEQRRLISGYKAFANTEEKMQRWKEANLPAHATLSLTGEPMFYPKMNELIKVFTERGISTFIVHNGTLPEAILALKNMPTQFYISLQAPNKELYMKVTRPKIPDAWERFLKSLSIMKDMKTRTVLRLTLVKGLNMTDADGYASLIKIAMPNYVEVKGFSYVGGSRNEARELSLESMPKHEEIKAFAEELASKISYKISAEHRLSRVVLLCRDEDSERNRIIDFSKIGKG
ncbi:MAG: 4-demethylwyosine synthase TYW1 [Candidatus Micrarchaeia archaeon]